MNNLPVNLIPWTVSSFVLLLLSIRSLTNYRRVRSPLSKYFAIGGLLAAIATGLWSLPYLYYDPETNKQILRTALLVGDLSLYLAFIYQVRIMWYLMLRKHIKYVYLLIPSLILAVAGYYGGVAATLADSTYPRIINERVFLPTSQQGDVAQSIFLLTILITGVYFLRKSYLGKSRSAKLGTFALGILYLGIGLGSLLNIIISTESGTNTSPFVLITYFIGTAVFLMCFIFFRIYEYIKAKD